MQPVEVNTEYAEEAIHLGAQRVTFQGTLPGSGKLPAIAFNDGSILTQWELSAEECQAIVAGKPINLWIWASFMPHIALQVEGIDYGEEAV